MKEGAPGAIGCRQRPDPETGIKAQGEASHSWEEKLCEQKLQGVEDTVSERQEVSKLLWSKCRILWCRLRAVGRSMASSDSPGFKSCLCLFPASALKANSIEPLRT